MINRKMLLKIPSWARSLDSAVRCAKTSPLFSFREGVCTTNYTDTIEGFPPEEQIKLKTGALAGSQYSRSEVVPSTAAPSLGEALKLGFHRVPSSVPGGTDADTATNVTQRDCAGRPKRHRAPSPPPAGSRATWELGAAMHAPADSAVIWGEISVGPLSTFSGFLGSL